MDIPPEYRERLGRIEQACKDLEAGSSRLSSLARRLSRTKAAKALEALQAEMSAYQAQVTQLQAFIEEQTWEFFAEAFGVYPDGIVRATTPGERCEDLFVVNQAKVRLLSDGKAVLFLAGDSLSRRVGPLPQPVMLSIQEGSGTKLEVEA